jgi:two-component sensor histidine kinase
MKTSKIIISILLLNFQLISQGNIYPDSLFAQEIDTRLSVITDEGAKIDSLFSWSKSYLGESDRNKSLTIFIKGAELCESLDSLDSQIVFQSTLAFKYWAIGEHAQVEKWARRSVELYKILDRPRSIPGTLGFIANSQKEMGKYDEAYRTELENLKYSEELEDNAFIASSLLSITRILHKLNRIEEGQIYLDRCLNMMEEWNDENWMVDLNGVRTSYEITNGNYEKALVLLEAQDTSKMTSVFRTSNLTLKGEMHYKLNQFFEAKVNLREALTLAVKKEDNRSLMEVHSILGDIYYAEKDYEKSVDSKSKSLLYADASGLKERRLDDLKILSDSYIKLKEYERGHDYFLQYSSLKDSTFNAERDKVTSELKTQYESERKDQKIQIQKQEIKQTKLNQKFSFGIAGLLFISLLGVFSALRSKQRYNKELEDKNTIIQKKSDQNETLLKEIHHRVKNNLQTISSLLYLQSYNVEDPTAKNTINVSQQRVESMALIHKNLYQRDNLAAIELKGYFSKLIENLISAYDSHNIIQATIEMEAYEIDVDTAIPLGLIVNEVITNALKYAFPDKKAGEIRIEFHKTQNMNHLRISDNGKGKPMDVKENFGTKLINLLTRQIDGTIRTGNDSGYWVEIVFESSVKD